MDLYDTIGRGYRELRRQDPRIAAQILRALEGASSIVNVGAGTGSYEPRDRSLVAVEPSIVMIRQRDHGAAPAISTFSRLRNVQHGLAALRRDLASGEWQSRYGDLLRQSTLDLGYQLVVA